MRKLIVIILAFMHLSASAGVTMHMHYCMGKVADWGLTNKESRQCGKCGMEKSVQKDNGCCKDETTFIKDATDQKTAESFFQLIQIVAVAMPSQFVELPAAMPINLTVGAFLSHAPPGQKSIALFLKDCSFLI